MLGMMKTSGEMHVAKITTKRVDKSGQPREYVSHLLRRTYRDGNKAQPPCGTVDPRRNGLCLVPMTPAAIF